MPTNCVWLDGIAENVDERMLARAFHRHGPIAYVVIDRDKGRALLYFDSPDLAQRTVNDMRGRVIGGRKIQVGDPNFVPEKLFRKLKVCDKLRSKCFPWIENWNLCCLDRLRKSRLPVSVLR